MDIEGIFLHTSQTLVPRIWKEVHTGNNDEEIESESETAGNKKSCKLCEEFTSQATHYLSEHATRSEIPSTIHTQSLCRITIFGRTGAITSSHGNLSVSEWYSVFAQQTVSFVSSKLVPFVQCVPWLDYLAPIFFLEPDNSCRDVVAEVITKLEDPETELEVIEILLKGCNKLKNYVQKCKKLIFHNGTLILVHAEKFLLKVDVCAIHACKNSHELVSIVDDGCAFNTSSM
ncbi:uncharacterized protein LOC122031252 [Zingiber officinale]|uniref:uncharacterized protein LOC122031252 n=1 Tax=Zingiber officinale TaxID=94328 RepID=UPI001C4D23A6|nr:uncharacterized protein LOC122031252 [Zingiber officinale]